MRHFCVLGAAFVVAVVGQTAFGQALQDVRGPAETPPSSYSGSQYVDSKGCVFIRAGVGGNTRWVPRVTRSREVICGQQPTGVRRATTVAAAPKPAAPKPVTRVVRTAPAVAAAPRVVVQQPVAQPVRRVYQQPAQAYEYVTPPAASTVTSTRTYRNLGGRCANRSVAGNQYTNSGTGVRCGAQAWDPSQEGRIVRAAPTQQGTVSYGQQTTYSQRQVVTVPRSLSHGNTDGVAYRQAWNDGRLNPTRGLNTTVVGRTGAVATATDNSWYPPRPSVSTRSYVAAQPTYHAPKRASVGSGHRFVQVGTFGVQSNATRSLRRLQAMGLPARTQRSGRYTVVLAGPFNNAGSVRSALNTVRRNGYGDAFTRR